MAGSRAVSGRHHYCAGELTHELKGFSAFRFLARLGRERGEPEVKALREDENLLVLRSYECCSEHLNG
ncbi:hypothetical protein L483_22235 [Pseudomonas putida H8234]|nr:hypothetical protein L483_22235 [Pseudomonas putida H8234]QDY39227.1 hypothetical protein CHR26_24355 [Pseudomonas putida]